MKDEQIIIEIAEACGWKPSYALTKNGREERWISPNDVSVNAPPNYLNDLNAMHEAERVLSHVQRKQYEAYLNEYEMGVFSYAYERAEAFLRTIGKWVEA